MNRYAILIIPALIFFVLACGDRKNNKVPVSVEQSELPPSLQDKAEVSLVKLTPRQQQDLKIETTLVSGSFVDNLITAPGVVFPAPEHSSIISTPISGQVHEINKYEGSWVQEGEPLFKIQSLEFGTLVSEYLQAHAEEHYQSNRLNRMKQLVEETISSVSELERATSEYQRASASVRASYSKLKALGVLDKEIDALVHDENIDPVLLVHAPISGMVEKLFVETGQSVNALENLSRVLDTRSVLVRGYISPDDARLVNKGDSVRIMKRENDPGSKINAVITSVNPGLDENSRSVVVNTVVPAIDNWPRPGENVRLEIISSSLKEIIAIPVESLSYDGNMPVVFVQIEAGVFEKRFISISEIGARHVLVESGLKDGESVASSKIFNLKALSRYDIIAEE